MLKAHRKSLPIFGPPRAWRADDFTASDDRVRGGSSQSYMEPSVSLDSARFYGTLDTQTLGGAGFASQRTTSVDKVWDLSQYAGLELVYLKGDGKRYTLNLKTVIPGKMPNGRDASTIEYAYSFKADQSGSKLWATWDEFKPFYRGKPQEDAESLDLSKIRRWSLMMRSFFEEQSGPFSLTIRSISARLSQSSSDAQESSSEEIIGKTNEKDLNEVKQNEEPAAPTLLRLCSIL